MRDERKEHGFLATEGVLARAMTAGVIAAGAVALLGAVLYLRGHAHDAANFRDYAPQPDSLSSPGAVVADAWALRPAAVIQLGVLVLVLTPVIRVAFSLVLFALRRDAMYTLITGAVLAVLLLGLLGGLG